MANKGPLIDLFPNYKPVSKSILLKNILFLKKAGAQTLFQDTNAEKCLKTIPSV